MTTDPLIDRGRRYTDQGGKLRLRPNNFAGLSYLVHFRTLAVLNSKVNSQANYSIA